MFFKAEDVGISDVDGGNVICGDIVLHNFKGGVVQLRVKTRCENCLLVDVPADRYALYQGHPAVKIHIPPEACHVYNVETGKYAVAPRAGDTAY